MTQIRSLADELREKMRQGELGVGDKPITEATNEKIKPVKQPGKKAGKQPPVAPAGLEELLDGISAFELTGNEKLLIRLDNRTVFLMKQLKVARSIDMNKLIAFSVDAFFSGHPELIAFVKSTLQTIEL